MLGQKFIFLMYSVAKIASEISITNISTSIFSFNFGSNSGSHMRVIPLNLVGQMVPSCVCYEKVL